MGRSVWSNPALRPFSMAGPGALRQQTTWPAPLALGDLCNNIHMGRCLMLACGRAVGLPQRQRRGFIPAQRNALARIFHRRPPCRRRSADLRSAVSQVCNLRTPAGPGTLCRLEIGDTADRRSALPASPPCSSQLGHEICRLGNVSQNISRAESPVHSLSLPEREQSLLTSL